MNRKHRLFLLVTICALCASQAIAQKAVRSADSLIKPEAKVLYIKPKGPDPLLHEMSGGFRLNTNGWSIFTDIGKFKAKNLKQVDMFHDVRIWQIEFTEKKNPKEYKSTSTDGSGTNTYIYGKINNFYALKLGWGYRKQIVGKPDPGTLSIHWVNTLGVSIGLLKPYYLNVYSNPGAVKYNDATKKDFLDQGLIEGNAGFSKGLSEVKVVPGGHFKSALHFDFSGNKKMALGVELGVNAEYYSQELSLMANQPATAYFTDLYIGLQVGKRW